MAVEHALELALALLALVCLPAVIAAVLCADELIDRVACAVADWREVRRQRRTIKRLERALDVDALVRGIDLTEFDRAGRRGIEQIAADLRRLGGQRLGVASRSQLWRSAVLQAYDDRLRMASRCLGVAEHLGDLDGIDLEIERIRVEGELQAAGLSLPAASAERGWRQR